jgi:CheY-like chemotaxis protein
MAIEQLIALTSISTDFNAHMHTIPETKPVSLLLVDDDDVDVMGIERALQKLKIANPITRARDGEEALALLRHHTAVARPYIILLDINMPVMNGFEFLTALRHDPALRRSVVFVLTTSQSEHDIVTAYDKNVAGYIVKKQFGDGFMRLAEMLDRYWRVVEVPTI